MQHMKKQSGNPFLSFIVVADPELCQHSNISWFVVLANGQIFEVEDNLKTRNNTSPLTNKQSISFMHCR